MNNDAPLKWMINEPAATADRSEIIDRLIPLDATRRARTFHRQIPGYRISPLLGLDNLASMLGLGGIWVKDESQRLALNSFKVLGGSFAVYRYLTGRLGREEATFAELIAPDVKKTIGEVTFATATDGNHGRGVAWAAAKLGHASVVYVHEHTVPARIKAIESYGARVEIVPGTYDDAVRKVRADAEKFGWQVISDTSWEGYEEIPTWVLQGYTTMFSEAQEQLSGQGLVKPTHVFIQAGVGALASAVTAFYHNLFGADAPLIVVAEPALAACLYESARIGDGRPHSFPGRLDTIMAGLACGDPSPLAWEILWNCADVFLACQDYVAALGMRIYGGPLKDDPYIVSGESGAVTLGALPFITRNSECAPLREALRLDGDSQVLLLNTEGNTDPLYFRQVVWKGDHPVPDRHWPF